MNNNPHIEWDNGKEMYVAWNEASLPIGYFNTLEEAEIAFEEYCIELMKK